MEGIITEVQRSRNKKQSRHKKFKQNFSPPINPRAYKETQNTIRPGYRMILNKLFLFTNMRK